jgi:hypothetical protein
MKVKEMKELLRMLVEKELEEEYYYQATTFISNDGTKTRMSEDKEYLAQLIACKQWLIKGTSMPLIESMIIKEDIEKYLKGN